MNPTNQQPLTKGNPVQFRRYYRSLEPLIGKPKNRLYTTTILSFLVISLFLWYAIRPTIQTILSLRREIKDNIEVNKQMEDKISSLVIAQSLYQEAAPKLALLSEALPKKPEVIPFLQQVQNLAQQNNASVSGIQLSLVPLDGKAEATPGGKPTGEASDNLQTYASVSIDGTYASLHEILTGIITMRRLATVQAMTFTPLSDSKEGAVIDPVIRVIFKFSIPYQGEKNL